MGEGMTSCGWPFHLDPDCTECKDWERRYGEGVDEWMKQRSEVLAAAKDVRRAQSKDTGATS